MRPDEVHALRGRINGKRGAVSETAAATGIARFQLHRLTARYEIALSKGEELDQSPWSPGRCGIEETLAEDVDGASEPFLGR